MQRAEAQRAEAAAIRAQAAAVRQGVEADEQVVIWTLRTADAMGDSDEAARVRQHADLTKMEIATLEKEAARYDAEAVRAEAQAQTIARESESARQNDDR